MALPITNACTNMFGRQVCHLPQSKEALEVFTTSTVKTTTGKGDRLYNEMLNHAQQERDLPKSFTHRAVRAFLQANPETKPETTLQRAKKAIFKPYQQKVAEFVKISMDEVKKVLTLSTLSKANPDNMNKFSKGSFLEGVQDRFNRAFGHNHENNETATNICSVVPPTRNNSMKTKTPRIATPRIPVAPPPPELVKVLTRPPQEEGFSLTMLRELGMIRNQH
jgi:hypothetical protein